MRSELQLHSDSPRWSTSPRLPISVTVPSMARPSAPPSARLALQDGGWGVQAVAGSGQDKIGLSLSGLHGPLRQLRAICVGQVGPRPASQSVSHPVSLSPSKLQAGRPLWVELELPRFMITVTRTCSQPDLHMSDAHPISITISCGYVTRKGRTRISFPSQLSSAPIHKQRRTNL